MIARQLLINHHQQPATPCKQRQEVNCGHISQPPLSLSAAKILSVVQWYTGALVHWYKTQWCIGVKQKNTHKHKLSQKNIKVKKKVYTCVAILCALIENT